MRRWPIACYDGHMSLKERTRNQQDVDTDRLLEVAQNAAADSAALAPRLKSLLAVEIPALEKKLAEQPECSLETARLKNELANLRQLEKELKQTQAV